MYFLKDLYILLNLIWKPQVQHILMQKYFWFCANLWSFSMTPVIIQSKILSQIKKLEKGQDQTMKTVIWFLERNLNTFCLLEFTGFALLMCILLKQFAFSEKILFLTF